MILRFFAAVFADVRIRLPRFCRFAAKAPRGEPTDAVIVLTGGPGRIARGLSVVDQGLAKEMFVSGVDPEVRPAEFAAEFDVSRGTMECCVKLGYLAVDTRTNAGEAAQWLRENKFTSVRLVTTDWHMARASSEFEETLPPDIRVVEDAVSSHPSLATLFLEYNKLLAAVVSQGLPS